MTEPRRRSPFAEPLRGAGYLLALCALVLLVATLVAVGLIWAMR